MCILDSLPIEDLLSVSYVSKGLHALVKPLIFRSITWTWDVVPMQSILRLLHTILQHNELALHIQHVKILCSPGRPYDMAWKAPWHEMDWSAKQLEYSDVVEQAQAIVNKVKFPNAEKWNKALQDGNPYAFVTIILSQLHNLKSFQLDYSSVLDARVSRLDAETCPLLCSFRRRGAVSFQFS